MLHYVMDYRTTTAIVAVAWLYLITGTAMLVAPFFAFTAAGGLALNLALLPLGALVLGAGIGLLRGAPWGFALALMISVSGVVVTALRLWGGGGAEEGLVAALVTNLLTLVALAHARTSRRAANGNAS
jgi:hypothetical protein